MYHLKNNHKALGWHFMKCLCDSVDDNLQHAVQEVLHFYELLRQGRKKKK